MSLQTHIWISRSRLNHAMNIEGMCIAAVLSPEGKKLMLVGISPQCYSKIIDCSSRHCIRLHCGSRKWVQFQLLWRVWGEGCKIWTLQTTWNFLVQGWDQLDMPQRGPSVVNNASRVVSSRSLIAISYLWTPHQVMLIRGTSSHMCWHNSCMVKLSGIILQSAQMPVFTYTIMEYLYRNETALGTWQLSICKQTFT